MVHLKQPRLSGLGQNPAAPTDVMVRLAAHPAGRSGLRTREGRLPDEVAEALLTHGDSRSAVALHGRRVSPAMRRRIAEHPDPAVRNAYADFVRDMLERGVPMDFTDLVEVHGRSPAELAADPDPLVRATVAATWADRPVPVQVAFLADPDPKVRAAATRAERPGVPPEHRDRCLADPAVRANVARRVPLTPDSFARLLATGDQEVLHAVAANPYLTADMVAGLQDSEDPVVRVAVACSRHVTPETRDRLLAVVEAEEAAGSDDAALALRWFPPAPDWLRDAPLAERLTYLDCPHPVFRQVLATGRDLPDRAWRRLDDDPDPTVRRNAARRPDAPPEVLLRLLREHGDVHHVRPMLVDHPNFPRRALRGFVDDPDPRVRVLALRDPDLPLAQLRQLAACGEPFLRVGVAGHPALGAELVEELLADPEPDVAHAAAAHPVLPRARMDRILAQAGL
ncbi:hypothetical protein ACIRUY_33700 [Streptomyces erythrochromogenes]|uniref:hypothetical protein n=1 Tax=Streptomyces erythrochromogenes TaxID=285574 RepID=UPI003425E3C7